MQFRVGLVVAMKEVAKICVGQPCPCCPCGKQHQSCIYMISGSMAHFTARTRWEWLEANTPLWWSINGPLYSRTSHLHQYGIQGSSSGFKPYPVLGNLHLSIPSIYSNQCFIQVFSPLGFSYWLSQKSKAKKANWIWLKWWKNVFLHILPEKECLVCMSLHI